MIIKPELLNKVKYYFGLNIYEGKTWLALLSKGAASAGEIAELSGVPRSRTYDVLESLEKQGFVIQKLDKPVKYLAVKPDSVIEKLKSQVTRDEIGMAMQKFIGEIDQVPPTYAAIKIGGKKMYEAAREGKPIVASPRHVTVHAFNLIEITPLQPLPSLTPLLSLRVPISCSSCTYIRAIARDLGRALKTGAYVEDLRRTRIGPIPLTEAVPLSTLNTETVARYLLPIPTLLARLVPALPTS